MRLTKRPSYWLDKYMPVNLSIAQESVVIFLISKIAVIALLVGCFYSFPHNYNLWNRWFTGNILDAVVIPFSNWDAQHYLLLGRWGYAKVWAHSVAFYPLFPTVISMISLLTRNVFLSAFLVTLLASYGSILYMYLYASQYLQRNRARLMIWVVLAFPCSFFLSIFYAEALFLLAFFGFLYSYNIQKRPVSILWAMLLPLTKGQGFFLAAGFGIYLLWKVFLNRKSIRYELMNMLGFIIGMALYFQFYYTTRGSYWAGIVAQKTFVTQLSVANLFNPRHVYEYLASPSHTWFAYNNAIVDKLFVVLMFGLLFYVLKDKLALHIPFYLMLVYPPMAMGFGASFARYALVAFPLAAIAYFRTASDRPLKWIATGVMIGIFVLVQILFIYRFATNQWVS